MFSRFSKISPIALTYAYLAFCPQTLRAQENCGANRPQRFEFQKFEELLHELGPKPSPKRYEEMLQSFSDRCSFDGNYVNASNEEIPLIEHLAEHLFQNDNGLMNVIGRLCNRNDLTICLTLLNGQSRVTEYYRGRYKKKPADSDYKPDAAEMEQVEEIRGNFLLLYDKFDSDAALPARIAVLIFLAGLGDVDVSAKVEETGNRLAVLSQDQIKLSLLAFSGSDFDVVTGSSLTTLYSLIWKPLVEAYQRGSAIASANAVLFQQLPRHIEVLPDPKNEAHTEKATAQAWLNATFVSTHNEMRTQSDASMNESFFSALNSLAQHAERIWNPIGQPIISQEVASQCSNRAYFERFNAIAEKRPDLSRLISPEKWQHFVKSCITSPINREVQNPMPSGLLYADCGFALEESGSGATMGILQDNTCFGALADAYASIIKVCRPKKDGCHSVYREILGMTDKQTDVSSLAMIEAFYRLQQSQNSAPPSLSWHESNSSGRTHCVRPNPVDETCRSIPEYLGAMAGKKSEAFLKATIHMHVLRMLKERRRDRPNGAEVIKPYYRPIIQSIKNKSVGDPDSDLEKIAQFLFEYLKYVIENQPMHQRESRPSAGHEPTVEIESSGVTRDDFVAVLELIAITGEVWRGGRADTSYAFEASVLQKVREFMFRTTNTPAPDHSRDTERLGDNSGNRARADRSLYEAYIESESAMDDWMKNVEDKRIRRIYIEGLKAPLSTVPGYFAREGSVERYLSLIKENRYSELQPISVCYLLDPKKWQKNPPIGSPTLQSEVENLAKFLFALSSHWRSTKGIRIDCGGEGRARYVQLPAVRPVALAAKLAGNDDITKDFKGIGASQRSSIERSLQAAGCLVGKFEFDSPCAGTENQDQEPALEMADRKAALRFVDMVHGADAIDDLGIFLEDLQTPPKETKGKIQRFTNGMVRTALLDGWQCTQSTENAKKQYYCGFVALFLPNSKRNYQGGSEEEAIRDSSDKRNKAREGLGGFLPITTSNPQNTDKQAIESLYRELGKSLGGSSNPDQPAKDIKLDEKCGNVTAVMNNLIDGLRLSDKESRDAISSDNISALLNALFRNNAQSDANAPTAIMLLDALDNFDRSLFKCASKNSPSASDLSQWIGDYEKLYLNVLVYINSLQDTEVDLLFLNASTTFADWAFGQPTSLVGEKYKRDDNVATAHLREIYRLPALRLSKLRQRLADAGTPKYIYEPQDVHRGGRDYELLQKKGVSVTLYGPSVLAGVLWGKNGNGKDFVRSKAQWLVNQEIRSSDQTAPSKPPMSDLAVNIGEPLLEWILRESSCQDTASGNSPDTAAETTLSNSPQTNHMGDRIKCLLTTLAGSDEEKHKKFSVVLADPNYYAKPQKLSPKDKSKEMHNYLTVLRKYLVVQKLPSTDNLVLQSANDAGSLGARLHIDKFKGTGPKKPKSRMEFEILKEQLKEGRHAASNAPRDWTSTIERYAEFLPRKSKKEIYEGIGSLLSNESQKDEIFNVSFANLAEKRNYDDVSEVYAGILGKYQNSMAAALRRSPAVKGNGEFGRSVNFLYQFFSAAAWNGNSGAIWRFANSGGEFAPVVYSVLSAGGMKCVENINPNLVNNIVRHKMNIPRAHLLTSLREKTKHGSREIGLTKKASGIYFRFDVTPNCN